ncbi:MAG: hypothetical protein GY928_22590 [Colwellia sp.]|nr:hypothetical protein [Colwellia sp.]
MKSAKTKAEEFFEVWGNDTTDATIVYALELLLKEHERDTRSVAVQLAHNHSYYEVDTNYNETEVLSLDLVEELRNLEVKDEEANN